MDGAELISTIFSLYATIDRPLISAKVIKFWWVAFSGSVAVGRRRQRDMWKLLVHCQVALAIIKVNVWNFSENRSSDRRGGIKTVFLAFVDQRYVRRRGIIKRPMTYEWHAKRPLKNKQIYKSTIIQFPTNGDEPCAWKGITHNRMTCPARE